ncbi:hypothetical protein N4G62_17530 [Sphingomonas sanguinis]|uniref:Uncharacterized protein n=1 Tax=Sphingomonas sanguinis TaxID=33051 RepID=A0ABU5LV74_9SPHN|nr:hypothetical protein [Sphingomonas sanguinis]MDZ7283833.1 hypothetical protein [Sphingomonas sanguinis]
MALSELQDWIMRELAANRGMIEGMPSRPGVSFADMEAAIDRLRDLRFLEVVGPPNQNSDLGKDVDELRLLSGGISYVRRQR